MTEGGDHCGRLSTTPGDHTETQDTRTRISEVIR